MTVDIIGPIVALLALIFLTVENIRLQKVIRSLNYDYLDLKMKNLDLRMCGNCEHAKYVVPFGNTLSCKGGTGYACEKWEIKKFGGK